MLGKHYTIRTKLDTNPQVGGIFFHFCVCYGKLGDSASE